MRRYAGVLLDVDGTLVDSNDAHARAWVETFADHDIEVSFERVRRMIGMGGDRLIEQILGIDGHSKRAEKISKRRSELFRERWLPHVRPLLGARALVLRLRAEGYQIAIASAAKADELEPLLAIADVGDLVEHRVTSSEVSASKPDPATIDAALARLPTERSRTAMVGDTPYDVEAARAASVDVIGFTSGGWPAEALAGTVAIYAGPAALVAAWDDSPLGDRCGSPTP